MGASLRLWPLTYFCFCLLRTENNSFSGYKMAEEVNLFPVHFLGLSFRLDARRRRNTCSKFFKWSMNNLPKTFFQRSFKCGWHIPEPERPHGELPMIVFSFSLGSSSTCYICTLDLGWKISQNQFQLKCRVYIVDSQRNNSSPTPPHY